jgi:hypothetical protein
MLICWLTKTIAVMYAPHHNTYLSSSVRYDTSGVAEDMHSLYAAAVSERVRDVSSRVPMLVSGTRNCRDAIIATAPVGSITFHKA